MTLEPDTERILITYRIKHPDPRAVADAIRTEQTIEFPFDLAPQWIQESVVGQIESIEGETVQISYPVGVTGGGLLQFLNVLWGNVSLLPGIRVTELTLPPGFLSQFQGPRFGVAGLRTLFDAPTRPLLCTALKPMGQSSDELAATAATLTQAGFDMIKDDHGLANQPWAPWAERVQTIARRVQETSAEFGNNTVYMPSLNVPADQLLDAAHQAKAWGAGALLVLPGLTGMDSLRVLAADDQLALPIMTHPSFLGSIVVSPDQGIDHGILFGTIMRLAGADISIFPNHGGRFSFSENECLSIKSSCAATLGKIPAIWPSPGGGMTLDRIDELINFYGQDVVLLVGGALHRGDLLTNARSLVEKVAAN